MVEASGRRDECRQISGDSAAKLAPPKIKWRRSRKERNK
jgi:hypothetical protein